MPVEGFDDASKNINKKRKERKRGLPGTQKVRGSSREFRRKCGRRASLPTQASKS